jgi:indole-3-glycerol phosphate synthase
LIAPGVSLIAEMKRASPSRGPIRPDADVTSIVRAYEQGGAAACSILTEPQFFGGSLDDLRAARAACTLPLLRKDFIVDCYQLAEARLAGADAALLIVAALEEAEFAELLHFGGELGLDLLVEAHTEDEVQAAVDGGAEIVGINNRNLKTLEVDPDTVLNLLADIPAGTVVVAESGISERADVIRLGEAGVDAILVGEALMREDDPAAAIRSLIGTT